ncbi:hypothetical protein CLF_109727 [Clonorchis sinensis]|uniref:Uncharacterized protein n=1 Tax=Clonorchis sinensis TaxID=79923 RepID=G7YJQ5_CLOSI|nr:hypothetical protein CLF_109727 [Clonorchis sinensis]
MRRTISIKLGLGSPLVLTYDSTEDHLTSATLAPALSYPYSTHSQLSVIDDVYNVDSDTDNIFSTADIQNNNQTSKLEKYGTISDLFHERNIWTEGLEWPEEELFVIHSNPKRFERQCDLKGEQGRMESCDQLLENPRRHGFGLKPNISLELISGKGSPAYEAQTNDLLASIRDWKQSLVGKNVANDLTVNSHLVKTSSDPTNPMAILQAAQPDAKREKRIREYLSKYFPGKIHSISEEFFEHERDGCNESKDMCQRSNLQKIKDPRRTRAVRSLERTVCFEPLPKTISKHRSKASEKQPERKHRKPEQQQQKLTNAKAVHKNLTAKTQDSNVPKLRRRSRVTIAAQDSSETPSNDKSVGFRDKTTHRIHPSNLGDVNTTANSEENRKNAKCLRSSKAQMESTKILKKISKKPQLEKRTSSTTPLPKQNGMVVYEKQTKNCVEDLSFPARATIESNGFADKISQLNRLQGKLEKIRRQIKQLQSYNSVGRVFCIADASIRILCAQLAPHILLQPLYDKYAVLTADDDDDSLRMRKATGRRRPQDPVNFMFQLNPKCMKFDKYTQLHTYLILYQLEHETVFVKHMQLKNIRNQRVTRDSDLRSKNRRFASVNLLALPRSFVDSILQLKAPWKNGMEHPLKHKPVKHMCLKEDTSAISILDEESESGDVTKSEVPNDKRSPSTLFEENFVHPQMATSREIQKAQKNHRNRIGKLCHLMVLPSWEQKYMGLRRNKRTPSAIMLAWKDKCGFSNSHSGWLRRTAQKLIRRRNRHN